MVGPVESCPDGAGGVVAFDVPVGSEGADDVESVVPGRVARSWGPGAAIVLDLDPGAMTWVNLGPDGKAAARQARAAVDHFFSHSPRWSRARRRRGSRHRPSGSHRVRRAGRHGQR